MTKRWHGIFVICATVGGFAAALPAKAADPDTAPINSGVLHQVAPVPPLTLSVAQRDRVRQVLKTQDTDLSSTEAKPIASFQPTVGAKLPKQLQGHPLPQPLLAEIPELARYTYVKFKAQLLIVNPLTEEVIDAFPEVPGATTAQAVKPGQTQPLSDVDNQTQGDQWQHTMSGQAGKQEPKPETPPPASTEPVFVNGALNVPGAAADGQTVPAKFSKRNNALDKLPIMAYPLTLNDEQRRAIRDSVRAAAKPVVNIEARVTEELPNSVQAYDLPEAIVAAMPSVRGFKYVPLKDKILLIYAPNMIVVGEIGV